MTQDIEERTNEDSITKKFRIPNQNYFSFEEKIAELNKRAKRLKCEPILIETLDIERVVTNDDVQVYVHVQVRGKAPRMNGWVFIAVLEHLQEENLVHTVPDTCQEGELFAYRSALPQCDHCQTKRWRNTTYILRSDVGELKQVGRQCLVDFLGHDDPMSVAVNAEFLCDACEIGEAYEDEDFCSGRSPAYYDLEKYLSWVHMTIRSHGWVSRAAEEPGRYATAGVAIYAMENHKKDQGAVPTDKDDEATQEALAWIRKHNPDDLSDYLYSLFVVCKKEFFPVKHIGIAASLFSAYNKYKRDEEKKEREQRDIAISQHQGKLGQRQVFHLSCDDVHYSDGYYGTTCVYTLRDTAGNVFVWFSSNDVLTKGCSYALNATVKEHSEYQGVKQTTITRAKIIEA